MRTFVPAVLLIAATATSAAAETRQLGAHVHGEGTLNIAFDGARIAMELSAPGADIVGFEHAAKTAEDRAAIDDAVATLAKPLSLVTFPEAAGCSVTEAAARLVTDAAHDDHGHEAHGHDDHAHEDHGHAEHAEHGHDDHAHDEHGHDHADADHGGSTHSEFRAEYVITCDDTGAIDTVSLPYFERFPNARLLDVQIVTPAGARAVEISREAPTLSLAGRS